jgi:hypothetical protein
MSFLSIFGKIGSTVGKVALGTVGTVVGVNGLGNVFDKKSNGTPNPAMVATSLPVGNRMDTQNVAGGSLLSSFTGFLNGATSFLTGQSRAKVDVHTAIGGTQDDRYNTSSMPSWLLPVGLIGLVVLLLSGGSRR